MTWLDVALIVFLILFIAVGARLGSLWTAACLAGGFLGAYLVDYYALPLSGMMGAFRGADAVASVLLFAGGVAVVLLPGWALSRVCAGVFLGVIDSAFGFLTGGLAAVFAVTLTLLLVIPIFPKMEQLPAWKKSLLVRPLHHFLEDTFNNPHFRSVNQFKNTAAHFVDELKKK